jgi:phasin family protein
MVADTNTQVETATDAANEAKEAVAETVKVAVDQDESAAKSTAKASEKTVKTARKAAKKSSRKARPARATARARSTERNDEMKFDPTNFFAGFGAFPGAAAFEKLFTEAAERGEEAAKRSRKAVEELAELYRGNIDAFVEAGRIATTGAQSIGQDIVAKGRDNLEQTANNVRTLAEAKSATELLQLQGDFARSAFDRFVEESSTLTESVVKLAGEAFQPLSNRASANVERLNEIAA